MPHRLKEHFPNKPKNQEADNAFEILCSTHAAASSFLQIFETSRKNRRAKGTPTDQEQDLLRAMLIFTSSGLDSMVKQLIRDALPRILELDTGAKKLFLDKMEKKIFDGNLNTRLLLESIESDSPRSRLVVELVGDITAGSMQSAEELLRAAAHFNIASNLLTKNVDYLKQIFQVRNQIAHEMDIDFKQPNRSRYPRRRDEMISFTNELFRIGKSFLEEVDNKLILHSCQKLLL